MESPPSRSRARSKSISGFFSRARSNSKKPSTSGRSNTSDTSSLPPSPSVHHKSPIIPTITTTRSRDSTSSFRPPAGAGPGDASPLSHSLALLDSKLASIEHLGGYKSKSTHDLHSQFMLHSQETRPLQPLSANGAGRAGPGQLDHLGIDELDSAKLARLSKTLSLSAFQLPQPRASGFFGNNAMLWEALGLDGAQEEDSEEHISMDHFNKRVDSPTRGAAFEEEEGHSPTSSKHSSVSTIEHSEDIFNLSEFPAYPELPSFSSSNGNASAIESLTQRQETESPSPMSPIDKRASNVLVFPIPPASPPTLAFSTSTEQIIEEPRLSEDSIESHESIAFSHEEEARPSLSHLRSDFGHSWTHSRPVSGLTDYSTGEHAATEHEERAFERLAQMVLASAGPSSDGSHGLGLGLSNSESNMSLGSLAASLGLSAESSAGPFAYSAGGTTTTTKSSTEEERLDASWGASSADLSSDISPPMTPNFSGDMDQDQDPDTSASSIGSFAQVIATRTILDQEQKPNTTTATTTNILSAVEFLEAEDPPRIARSVSDSESPSARVLRNQGTLPPIFRSHTTPWSPPETVTPIASAADTKPLGSPLTLAAPSFSRGASGGSSGQTSSASNYSSASEDVTQQFGRKDLDEEENHEAEWVTSPTSYLPPSPSIRSTSAATADPFPVASPVLPASPTSITSPIKSLSRRISFSLRRKKSEVGISSSDIEKQQHKKSPSLKSLKDSPSQKSLRDGYESDGASIKSSSSRKSRLSLYIPKRFMRKEEAPPLPSLPIGAQYNASGSRSAPATQGEFKAFKEPPLSASTYGPGSPGLFSATSGSTFPSPMSPASAAFPPSPMSGRNSPDGDGYFTFPTPQPHSIARKPSPTMPAFEPPPPPTQDFRTTRASMISKRSSTFSPLPSPGLSPSFQSAKSLTPDLLRPANLQSADSATSLASMRTASSSLASLNGIANGPVVPPEIVAFPVSLGPLPKPPSTKSPSLTPSASNISVRSNDAVSISSKKVPTSVASDSEEEENEDEEDSEEDSDEDGEDDKPLGTIPGAISSQKKLLKESRTQRRLAKLKANTSDPFEFENKSISPSSASPLPSPALPSSGEGSRTSTPSIGHSLLPHTDDAVERRQGNVSRSPSLILDPVISESTLTFDKPNSPPPAEPQPLPPSRPTSTKSATMPPASASSSSSSVRAERPVLTVNTAPPQQRATTQPPPIQQTPPQQTRQQPVRQPSQLSLAPPPRHQLPAPPAGRPAPPPTLRQMSSSSGSNLAVPSPLRHATPTGTSQHRIFIDDHTKHMMVTVSDITRCGDIVLGAKEKGVLTSGTNAEGGFALWEICRNFGVERPIREYEFLVDVVKSWDTDTNILIIRRTFLWPVLSKHLRPHPQLPKDDFVMIEAKKGKWVKRHLELKDGAFHHSRGERTKDVTVLCQLEAFDTFFVAPHMIEQLKAPKPFVFALKSLLPRAHFEDEADYCYFICVRSQEELNSWVKAATEARNVFARQREQMVLTAKGLASSPSKAAQPASSSPVNFSPSPLSRSDDTAGRARSKSTSARAPPASLGLSGPSSEAMGKAKSAPSAGGVAASRPDARLWASMGEQERTKWLKDSEKDARQRGQTLLDFAKEEKAPSMMSRLRSKSVTRR